MSQGRIKSALMPLIITGCAVLLLSNCKKKEETAIVEEVPAVVAPHETDTSATLAEEPSLKKVGKGAKGKKSAHGDHGTEASGHESHHNASASADQAGFSESGRFVVQVNVFKSKAQAAKLVEKLAAAGYPAYVAEVESPVPSMPGTYHRVRVGNFARVSDANAFGANTLTPMGYQFWVDNKKNDAVGGDGANSGSAGNYAPAAAPEPTPEPAPEPKPHRSKSKKSKTKVNSDETGMSSTPEMSMPSTPSTPSEPAVPAGESWGSPKTETPASHSSEPVATPKMEEKHSEMAAPKATEPASSSPTATPKATSDTGKVNLDEW